MGFANVKSAIVAAEQINNAALKGGDFCGFTFKGTVDQLVETLGMLYVVAYKSDDNRTAIIEDAHGNICNISCNGYVTGWSPK